MKEVILQVAVVKKEMQRIKDSLNSSSVKGGLQTFRVTAKRRDIQPVLTQDGILEVVVVVRQEKCLQLGSLTLIGEEEQQRLEL